MFGSTEYPFMNANLDGLVYAAEPVQINGTVISGLCGLELKTATDLNKGFAGDEIPDSYYYQVQHYMAVCKLDYFILSAVIFTQSQWELLESFISYDMDRNMIDKLVANGEHRIFVIPRNDDIISDLIKAESEFWYDYVCKDIMPPPTGNEREYEALTSLIRFAPEEVVLGEEYAELCEEYNDLKDQCKLLEAQCELLKNQKDAIKEKIMIAALGSGMTASPAKKVIAKAGKYKISWATQTRKSLDVDALKKNDLYDKFLKTTETKPVMRISMEKGKK